MDVQQQHPVPQGGQRQAHPILRMSQLRAPGTTRQPLSLFHQQIQSNLLTIPLISTSPVHYYKNGVWAQHLDDGVRMSTKMLMGWGCSLFFPNSKILVGSWQCYVCPSFPPLAT